MTSHSAIAPLKVGDEDFLVASMIERCPKTMMLRELTMNALEAARLAPENERLVEIRPYEHNGASKLVIWNTGTGMSALELHQMCDIAASIGKKKSLTGNFGMGAKVASLPSNQHGMRYRSCKDGRVSEVILCKREGAYGRLRRKDEDGEVHEVVDVTAAVVSDGCDISSDWTEVMLLGNRSEQDTVRDPYDGDPVQDTQWIATYLYHRFYRLPPGVRMVLKKGTNKLDGNRGFEPITARLERHFEKYETVTTLSGIKIHYLYDAPYDKATGHNRSISGAIASAVSTCAVVYRDEMYDVGKGRGWTQNAPIFGIPFGARHISVHIELPDDAPVISDGYRQFLRYAGGEQDQISTKDFAETVRDHRPIWLLDLIRSFAPESTSSNDIRDELQKLLNDLQVQRTSPRVKGSGPILAELGKGPGAESRGDGLGDSRLNGSGDPAGHKPRDLTAIPTGAKRADMFVNMERAPEIIPLHDDAEIEEKGVKGRAARYYIDTGQLFINMQYPAIEKMRALLEMEYASAADLDAMRILVQQNAERSIMLRVGRAVVYALAKQLMKEWDSVAVERALSPESLSVAADDYQDSLQTARRALGARLRVSKPGTDAEYSVALEDHQ
ncbi:ATP-binding protein [Rhodopseudomonas sp. HC1]|uniref:ATP-binding protein n=1 Tax=Rhodopseudomonas infernalis TaxID=2897386 RepID=UPI001EE99E13|nr:ATP-binding protein [Rhodopseudomonas infernalis]MCG6204600.1 ATP-binding protein [Rhodopseudomonas infernalis]